MAASQATPTRHDENYLSNSNSISSLPADEYAMKPEAVPQPKPKPSSWAALLQGPQRQPAQAGTVKTQAISNQSLAAPTDSASHVMSTMKYTGIANIVSNYQPTFEWTLLEPRGLINNVNTCFVNVVSSQLKHCTVLHHKRLMSIVMYKLDPTTIGPLPTILQPYQNHRCLRGT